MTPDTLVSILMPCFNYGRFLGEALESLMAQTYPYWECLVVDDGSTDNTKEVAQNFAAKDGRIIYIEQPNKGVSAARNKALQHSKGKYIQLLDADDMLKPDKLALHVAILESKSVDLVYSNALLFDDDSTMERSYRLFQLPGSKPVSGQYEILIEHLLIDNFFLTPSVIFRRSIYEKIGGFMEGLHGLEDWNYWYRAALHGFVFYHDTNELTHGIIRAHSTSSARLHRRMLEGRIIARSSVIAEAERLHDNGKLPSSANYVKNLIRRHKSILYRDKVAYAICFDHKTLSGIQFMCQHAYYSRKPFFAFYDGAHWIKERLKHRV